MRLLVRGAGQIVTVVENGAKFLAGKDMSSICVKQGPGPHSIAVDKEGNIAMVGTDAQVRAQYREDEFERVIDAAGGAVVPGMVDGHTHPVWAGDRVHEFAMKLAGATYMEVHKAGGGINFTVSATHAASEDELYELLKPRLSRMSRAGTTTVECKSGYGLDTTNEIKMLRVLERAKEEGNIEISSTFCGAHSVPRGTTAELATEDVINRQLPAVMKAVKDGQLAVDSIDVFCEKGVFEIDNSRKILEAGKKAGLRINFHGDELHPLGGAEMGASLGAEAISHLEEVSPAGVSAMASAGSVAVILPTTAYILRLPKPPVRDMINEGVIVAIGTDFNPNAYCLSMPVAMHLACVNLGMSLPEALAASTINSAHSLGRGATHGSLEVGKVGDLLVLETPVWEHLVYQLGQQDVIKHTVKRGKIV